MSFNPIVERKLRLRDGRISRMVTVSIGQPQATGRGDEHKCDYQIAGLGEGRVQSIYGCDGVQALLLALTAAGGDLYASNEYREGKLTFKYSFKGDLGMPAPKSSADLAPADATEL